MSRRTCQVWNPGERAAVEPYQCGEPAVDFVDLGTKVWLCARHWDEYMAGKPIYENPATRTMKLNDKP